MPSRKVVKTGGDVVKSPNGYPIQNPWIGIANTAQKQMHAMIRRVRLSPASRKRKSAKAPIAAPQSGSKLQVYLTGGNGNELPLNRCCCLLESLVLSMPCSRPFNTIPRPDRPSPLSGNAARSTARPGFRLLEAAPTPRRQSHSSALDELECNGLLVTKGATKSLHTKLTDIGDDLGRSLTACYTVAESWPLLKLVASFGNGNAGCVCEDDLLGIGYDKITSLDLNGLEQRAAPFWPVGCWTQQATSRGMLATRSQTMATGHWPPAVRPHHSFRPTIRAGGIAPPGNA